ncbi:dual specificity protein kinase shkA-like [Dysidea avara]|uniref:dual specificity protein kinase shkA-like n=1 Tax=Dysidea avara TaxID=196820 RepID=UPI003334408B
MMASSSQPAAGPKAETVETESETLKHLVISKDRVSFTDLELGRGSFGKVTEIKYDGKSCAAKEIHSLLLLDVEPKGLEVTRRNFLRECELWSTIRHPNVVQFLGVCYRSADDQSRLPVIVMEKMRGSVTTLVEKQENIPFLVKLSILQDVSLGLRCLHSRATPIVHRDLTPNNILLTPYLEAKITDLGVAKAIMPNNKTTMSKAPGTTVFMPPEALDDKPRYGPPLDVFSFGGVILHITSRQWPNPKAAKKLDPSTNVRVALSEVQRRQQYIDMMTGSDADLKPLVVKCLDDVANVRPSVEEISESIKQMKEVFKKRSTRDGMGRILWLAEITLKETKQTAISDLLKEHLTQKGV